MMAVTNLPWLTRAQMVEVDRLMIEEWHISLAQMMENAGRNLAQLTRRLLDGNIADKRVVVLSGAGNNGGGGMVAARHLHNWGAQVAVVLVGSSDRLTGVPAQQYQIIHKMGLLAANPDLQAADLIIDAIIGYGLSGAPRPPAADWITRANESRAPILALDNPSGLDASSGVAYEPCIRAAATLTLALPKQGLRAPEAVPYVGALYLADISVPPEVYAAPTLGLQVASPFQAESIIQLT
ncbi:MAG: NAD(P)H-hydrate epimerase [Brevefilum sp.]|nr:NAD(P)H-hydrate epimerase [Brevefilum sp.]